LPAEIEAAEELLQLLWRSEAIVKIPDRRIQ
jgi:hypothetical protein